MFKLSNMDDMEGFLVASYEDHCDEEIQTRKTRNEFIQEISCRHILHWNYRGLKEIPVELLGSVIMYNLYECF